jgi:hypothetical protein
MKEQEMEDLVWAYSDSFLQKGLSQFRRQHSTAIGRSDLIFRDQLGHILAVELKHGVLPRQAIYQLYDYYGALKAEFPTQPVELMVVANEVPRERRLACERHHIDCAEISEARFRRVAAEVGYTFRSEQTAQTTPLRTDSSTLAQKEDSASERRSTTPALAQSTDLLGFRSGTQQHFLLSLLLTGSFDRMQLWQQFAQEFVPDNNADELKKKKISFGVFLGDVQRPIGLYGGSRSLILQVDSQGVYSVDPDRLALVKKALEGGILARLRHLDFKKDQAEIKALFILFGLPCSDKSLQTDS